jgi:hypothetical protein
MKKVLLMLAAVGALSAFAAVDSKAAPAALAGIDNGSGSEIVLVAQGCGRGWHRGPRGRCVRNMGPGYGGCWWRRGPYGRWVLVCR